MMSTLSYSTLLLLFLCFIQWIPTIYSKSSTCATLGVHPDECDKYDSTKDRYFNCGGSPDKKIPMQYVNDDYCDCVHTAADEPGTSACNHGKFWCNNPGYRGRFIYSSLINDGLCDCCDGSDETNNPRIKCPNVCNEKAKEELQEFILQKKKYMEGIKVKNSLLQVAKSKLQQKKDSKTQILQDLDIKRNELKEKEEIKKIAEDKESSYTEDKKKRKEEEDAKKEAERKAQCEAEGRSNCDDPNASSNDDNANQNENESSENQEEKPDEPPREETPRERRRRERKDRYAERAARNKASREKRMGEREQEAKERMEALKREYETPKEVPPEGGKDDGNVVHTPDEEFPYPEEYRPHHDEEGGIEHTPDEEFPYPEEYRPHHEEEEGRKQVGDEEDDGFDWSEFDDEENEDIYNEPPPVVEEEKEESDPIEDELRDKARDARNAYNDVNREITQLEDDLKNIDTILAMDFGEKNIYASLFDECYSTKISKYDYEFCPFGTAQQKEGHSSTDLGTFKSFKYNDKKELLMSFEDGQKCWNGPKRSATVLFKCDTDNQIIDVLEPSTCKYTMTFHTPLACQQEELDQFTELINNQFKTEL